MFTANEKIVPVAIEDEMRNSYIDYAMSVIVGRALPDVKDGLKPVHRRIVHPFKDYKSSAKMRQISLKIRRRFQLRFQLFYN